MAVEISLSLAIRNIYFSLKGEVVESQSHQIGRATRSHDVPSDAVYDVEFVNK